MPTGLSQTVQSRSREANIREAKASLQSLIAQRSTEQQLASRNDLRSAQIGLGMRGDKRRTYRFRDDRVVDDITGKSTTCTRFMRGQINSLWT
jgi:protein subunit release factor A